MKLPIVCFSLYLALICTFVAANLDHELRASIDAAMKCRSREPSKGPVMAVTPSRFVQVVVILHERFKTPSCVKASKSPISVTDDRTWPFCVFGKCDKGRCHCAGFFVGPKCSTYSKKCWLMYCYLTSCHPAHQSLHCVCDPSLYGTKVATGVYWYDEGKTSKYIPPPSGWEDEPTGLIKLKSDSGIEMGRDSNAPDRSGTQNFGRGSKNQAGRLRNQGSNGQSSRKNLGGQKPGQDSRIHGKGALSGFKGTGSENEGEGEEERKTDVEEALEELEDMSPAEKLRVANIRLLWIVFSIHWILRIPAT